MKPACRQAGAALLANSEAAFWQALLPSAFVSPQPEQAPPFKEREFTLRRERASY